MMLAIRNAHFFETIYKHMLDKQFHSYIDGTNVTWNFQDVEEILIKDYGYRRTTCGGIM